MCNSLLAPPQQQQQTRQLGASQRCMRHSKAPAQAAGLCYLQCFHAVGGNAESELHLWLKCSRFLRELQAAPQHSPCQSCRCHCR